MEIELRHLRTVCGIADAGSITRAAIAAGTTQPALTAMLQRIERALGGRLFHRARDGVTPTAFGDHVLGRARAVIAAADEFGCQVSGWFASHASRCAVLGGIPGSVLVELADRLSSAAPGGAHSNSVEVRVDFSPRRLLDLLELGRLDAAIVVDYPGFDLEPPGRVLVRRLAVEPLFVALPADHPAAARAAVNLADLAGADWVLSPSDGAGWPEYFEKSCAQAGFQPRVRYRVAELRPLQDIIAVGRTISPCQATFTPVPGVVVRPLVDDPLWMRYLVAWHAHGAFGTRAEVLVSEARAAYRLDARRSPHYQRWLAPRTTPLGTSPSGCRHSGPHR